MFIRLNVYPVEFLSGNMCPFIRLNVYPVELLSDWLNFIRNVVYPDKIYPAGTFIRVKFIRLEVSEHVPDNSRHTQHHGHLTKLLNEQKNTFRKSRIIGNMLI